MAKRALTLAVDLIPPATSTIELAKRAAARRAVDEHVRTGMAIGVGSGSTIVYAIQRLAERAQDASEGLSVRCVPTSFQARQLCAAAGLPLTDLSECPELDVAIDGADEVELPSLDCIKGGGGCHTQEKIVACAARLFVLVADARKKSARGLLSLMHAGVPVEVLPLALEPVTRALRALGGEPVLRMGGTSKAGPMVTDNGNIVLDTAFEGGRGLAPGASARLHGAIKALPGVIETGFFPRLATIAYFGEEDGSVSSARRPE